MSYKEKEMGICLKSYGLWLKVKDLKDGAERSTACRHQLHECSSPITLLITAKGSGGCILFIRSIYQQITEAIYMLIKSNGLLSSVMLYD